MSKTFLIAFLLISSLIAACWLAAAAPQIANDAPGVSVALNGAVLLHRTAVNYPPAALRDGVQGTVSVQVKLDSTGTVSDAQVLTGPDELRKAALESVLQWHFAQEVAGSTRVIQIAFELPKASGAAAPATGTLKLVQPGTIGSIRVTGLSEQASAELLASLPIHEGDEWNAETAQKANQAVKAFDEHLSIRQYAASQSPSGAAQVDLEIGSTPGRIKVGGNVQNVMVIRRTPPIYPEAAKAAGIQGAVVLAAVIGKDGTVQELKVMSGPAELVEAAMDAVKQWVYKPTLLNGNPVQVETTVNVNFTLNQ
jgi:TonB family protein